MCAHWHNIPDIIPAEVFGEEIMVLACPDCDHGAVQNREADVETEVKLSLDRIN
jgi:hypothetical protein